MKVYKNPLVLLPFIFLITTHLVSAEEYDRKGFSEEKSTSIYPSGIFPLTCFNVATIRKLTITNKSHELTFPR